MQAVLPTRHYGDWTKNREISSFGTNDGAERLAFQTWHHFKEAFPPELVYEAVRSSPRTVSSCLDPFGGSGTTALTCQMLGVQSTTIEVNPFLADVIQAKLHRYDVPSLIGELARVRKAARRSAGDSRKVFADVPATFLQPGVKDRWLFDSAIADRLAALLAAIDDVNSEETARLFRVIVGGLLTEVSNVIVSGKGRRYRKNWAIANLPPERVDAIFATRAERAITDIQQFADRPSASTSVVNGDARTLVLGGGFDLAVFSPPYPNSFDYTDVYNVELWMLGYLRDWDENRALRTSTLSSHVQLRRDYASPPAGSRALDSAMKALDSNRDRLWSKWIPEMVGAYFADLLAVLCHVRASLQEGAQCWMVVGDSSYAGISVPVGKIMTQLAADNGWVVRRQKPFRHMKSSAQQGWRPDLAESLLVLEHSG